MSHGPYPRERIYAHSTSEREKDHIEDAVASYVNAMSPALYAVLSEGNDGYLREHPSFGGQLRDALLGRVDPLCGGRRGQLPFVQPELRDRERRGDRHLCPERRHLPLYRCHLREPDSGEGSASLTFTLPSGSGSSVTHRYIDVWIETKTSYEAIGQASDWIMLPHELEDDEVFAASVSPGSYTSGDTVSHFVPDN